MNDLKNIFEDDNLGGLDKIYFIPSRDITTIPAANKMRVVNGITIPTGKRFFELPFTLETGSFSDIQDDSENGSFYNKEVSAFLSNDDEYNLNILDDMADERFVLIAIDNNCKKRLCGSKEQPLKMKIERNTPSQIIGRPGTKVTFYGEGEHACYFYNV